MPGTLLSAFLAWSWQTFTAALWGREFYHTRFTDEKTESLRGESCSVVSDSLRPVDCTKQNTVPFSRASSQLRDWTCAPLHWEVGSYPPDHKGSHHMHHSSLWNGGRWGEKGHHNMLCTISFSEILTAFSAIRVPLGLTYLCIYQYPARESHTEPGAKEVLGNSWSNWAVLN